MLKLTAAALGSGWALIFLIGMTGHMVWDNKLLWVPLNLFMFAAGLGFIGGLDHEEHRLPLLLLGALSVCSVVGFAVFYFFLFGLVGR